jgi:kynurenine formamidase
MEIIDLSVPIVPSPPETPDLLRTEIEFSDHVAGAKAINDMFAVGPELLRDGEGWAVETFTRLGTHNSTHVDAPYHYNSTIRGEPAHLCQERSRVVRAGRRGWSPGDRETRRRV